MSNEGRPGAAGRVWQYVGLLLLVILAARFHMMNPPRPGGFKWISPGQDSVSRFERRFDAIRSSLPSSGRVGYVSDVPGDRLLSDFNGSMRFYLTQYTLTPLQVINSSDEPILVGDFRTPEAARLTLRALEFRVLEEAGNGVFLLKRVEP